MSKKEARVFSVLMIIIILATAGLFWLICSNVKVEHYRGRPVAHYWQVTKYQHTQEKSDSYPVGVADVVKFPLDRALVGDDSLVFYSVHQNVEVYIDDQLVYQSYLKEDNPVGKTPGNRWNEIPVYSSDGGRQVTIRLIPVYKTHVGSVPEIMMGNTSQIYFQYIAKQMIPFICAVVAMVYGVVFIVMTFAQYRNYKNRNELLFLGILSIVIGMWKLADLSVMHLYIAHPVEMSYRALILVMFLPIPFALYEKEILQTDKSKYLLYVAFASQGAIIVSWILQLLGVADLRQTLWIHHIMIAMVVLLSVVLTVIDVKTYGWTKKRHYTVISFAICVLGVVGDMAAFYFVLGKLANSFGMVGFLIYITIMGVLAMNEAKMWMELGHQAEGFRDMAFHDQMTGLFNRHAFVQHTTSQLFHPAGSTVIMLDLNDLKKCNDTFGHDVGDRYITSGAKVIEDTFGECGNIYRMGGDEFCILAQNVEESAVQQMCEKLQRNTEQWNATSGEEFRMQIACGYMGYVDERDFNIEDTLRHADHKMYENKIAMKQC